jgi:NitT/TauT family transport system ATP-binding protein
MSGENDNVVLKADNVSHAFGNKKILFDVNLRVYTGQILALVGPSGCGKSTLLSAIVGALNPTGGAILVSGPGGLTRVTRPGRDRGIVYQRYALYPFLTAVQNVAFGLMVDQCSLAYRLLLYPFWRRKQKRHLEEAATLLEKFGLSMALNLYPHEMSGGMCQRVAVAQALIMKPRILLLDEPFGALDEATREELQWMMRGLDKENRECSARNETPPHTIIIVTHEINEGLFVSDRLIGLSQYWGWKDEGFAECPGATIVYDQPSPVYELKEQRDLELFKGQREQVLKFVFESNVLQPRQQWVQELERFPARKGD